MGIKRKTRKQGNSVMINIPSEFKVEEGKEYTLVQKKRWNHHAHSTN